MTRTIELNEEQKKVFSEAFESAQNAAQKAQETVVTANQAAKVFEDLLTMFCASNKLNKTKLKIDPKTWSVLYEEEEKTLSL